MTDITLDQFRDGVLSNWKGDTAQAFSIACEVTYQAVIVHAKAKGTALVTAPVAIAKQVTGYITSFFTDVDKLALLRPKFAADSIHIGKVRILILPAGTPRRPRSILWRTDVVDAVAVADPLSSMSEEEKNARLWHALICGIFDDKTFSDPGMQKLFGTLDAANGGAGDAVADRASVKEGWENYHAALKVERQKAEDIGYDPHHPARDYHFLKATSVPSVSRIIPDNIHSASREDWLASKEFEEMRMRHNEESDWLERNRVNLKALTGTRR